MGINFTAGAVFGRKLYGGRSQHKVVDLGKPATRDGKACTEREAASAPRKPGTAIGNGSSSERVRATSEFQWQ